MLNESDFVLTTTDYIKEAYHREYNVPLDNIVCIPNFLPRWWIGGKVNLPYKLEMFKQNKSKKIRVGVVSSLSHYNIENVRELPDGKAVYEVKDKQDNLIAYEDEEGHRISIEEGNKRVSVMKFLDALSITMSSTGAKATSNGLKHARLESHCWLLTLRHTSLICQSHSCSLAHLTLWRS